MTRLSLPRLVAIAVVTGLLPLAVLAYVSVTMSGDAVRKQARMRVAASAAAMAAAVGRDVIGLGDLVRSYSTRFDLEALLATGRSDRKTTNALQSHLRDLQLARRGIANAFATTPDGRVLEIVPRTRAIVGKSFAFRDWYLGVSRTDATYVSRAYRSSARGRPTVFAVASPAHTTDGRTAGIIVAEYRLSALRRFTDDFARAEHVRVIVTDRHGTVLAGQVGDGRRLVSRRNDPSVTPALAGRTGIVDVETARGRTLAAFAPVPELGWVVSVSTLTRDALGPIDTLKETVATIAAALALALTVGIVVLARAIRVREGAETAAREQASVTLAVLNATPDAIMLTAPDGDVIVANAPAHRLTAELEITAAGGAEAALAAKTADPESYRSVLQREAADPSRTSLSELELEVSGRTFQRLSSPVRDAVGGMLGRLLVLRDVTTERAGERLKSDLVATVSHELRTPLTGILGFTELMLRQDPDPATRARYLRTIHGEATRLTKLVNDFLDLQRIEAGRLTLSLEVVDLRELVRTQTDAFSAQSAQHEIQVELPETPLEVACDRDRISQVVANLLSNALKYSPAGGVVRVRAEATGDSARVSVADQGIGITADQQPHVFTKFFRADSSDTRGIGGTGLGLALAREIVDAHAGRIGFESREGEGSTFWFELPLRGPRHGQRRVLLIENDRGAVALLRAHLEDEYEVETAATGTEGLSRALLAPPAAICLDVGLPGELGGWQVLAALKEDPATADVPVVVCTGSNGRRQASALGATDFLTKPFTPEQLRQALRSALPEQRGRVLVVEDDATIRELVAATLASEGTLVIEAGDGEAALTQIAEHAPDAIVLDLLMPRLDGFGVLERLHENDEWREIPVVVLTGATLTAEERRRLESRTAALLEKHAYSAAELRGLIARALAR